MLNRRSFFATVAGGVLALAASQASAHEHDWLSVGWAGNRSDHHHLICRGCRTQRIDVHNFWVGDTTREGLWTVRDYRRAFGYEPNRRVLKRAIAQRLAA